MKKLRITIALFLPVTGTFSQNLVPNPGFETTTCCPTNGNEISQNNGCVPGWFNPTPSDPDYLNSCGYNLSVYCGVDSARTGNAYAGFFVYVGGGDFREYLEIKLSDSLQPGKKYCFEMYVRLCSASLYATDDLGAHISIDSLVNQTALYFPVTPQVENQQGNVMNDTSVWVLISGDFIAAGGEKFLTIGNFKNDLNTTLDTTAWGMDGRSYYMVDDVLLYYCDTSSSVPPSPTEYATLFYPNPSDGNAQLEYSLDSAGEFLVYDAIGQIVFKLPLIAGNNVVQVNMATLAKGAYIYRVTESNKTILTDKLVIIK